MILNNMDTGTIREYSETVPFQYEDKYAVFMGMNIMVDPRVLIPRPETELLVSKAVELCPRNKQGDILVLDLCTGSGAVALGINKLMDNCRIIAADISEDAIDVARENMERAGKDIELIVSDVFTSFRNGFEESFDCIVSNPPYVSIDDYKKADAWVKAEPEIALCAGEEGMDILNVIIDESPVFLKEGGVLAVEIGYDQAEKVKKRFMHAGFSGIEGFRDFNGFERIVTGRKNG